MNIRELKEIFRLVEKTDFTEVEIVQGDWRLRVERGKAQVVSAPTHVLGSPVPPVEVPSPGSGARPGSSAVEPKEISPKESGRDCMVTSPFVGTFYRAPSPDADSYVDVGQLVKQGQALCIVEAMKLMNEIESDYDGKVVEIFPKNGQAVEYGENLFRIERTS